MATNRSFENPATVTYFGKSDLFHSKLALVVVEKVVAGIVVQVVVKFGDHQRWSELVACGAHG